MSLPSLGDAAISAGLPTFSSLPFLAEAVRAALHKGAAQGPRFFTPAERAVPEQPTRVILIGGLKGGVGKSTVGIFVAMVYAYMYGLRVLLVDADPSSQTGYDWWIQADDAGRNLGYDVETWPHAQVGDMVKRRALGQYDVVVIDCGGDSDKILSSGMEVAHFAVMVTSPSKTDMRRLDGTYKAALAAATAHGRANQIDAGVMMTQVDMRRGDQGSRATVHNQKMRTQIRNEGMPLMASEFSLKASVYSDSNGHRVTDPEDLAEASALVAEIETALTLAA